MDFTPVHIKGLWLKIPFWIRRRFNNAERFIVVCMIAGVVCGVAASMLHLSIGWVFNLLWSVVTAHQETPWFWCAALGLPAFGGLAVGLVTYFFAPFAIGSGIPQAKIAYYMHFGVIRLSEGVWRFLLGLIYLGTGNPLGREGPTVHMCASLSSWLGQRAGLSRSGVQSMVAVGMGAGIAAAFNAPLSAITFVFEELLEDYRTKGLAGLVIAVVIAAAVERAIFGVHPVFSLGVNIEEQLSDWMLLCIPLGVAAGLAGQGFQGGLVNFRGWVQRLRYIPVWSRPALGGLFVGLVGGCVFLITGHNGIFSIGYGDLNLALGDDLAFGTMSALFVGKFIVVIVCYAARGSGGIFSPTLFCGGMLGGVMGYGLYAMELAPISVIGGGVFLGMGGMMVSVMRCPLTSVLIIFEMTYNYALVLPLMLGNLVAWAISQKLTKDSIYDALLKQDGVILKKVHQVPSKEDYRNLPVSTIMSYDVVTLRAEADAVSALISVSRQLHSAYPVLDAQNNLQGMLTHDELESLVKEQPSSPLSHSLDDFENLMVVYPDMTIREVANALVQEDTLQAPVVSRKCPKHLIGIVTLHDVARHQRIADHSEN